MRMSTLQRINIGLILCVGLYGLLTDEPYWRSMGHSTNVYDVLFWAALIPNGPAGFLADWLAWKIGLADDTRHLTQYLLWSALAMLQWWAYLQLARWAARLTQRVRTVATLSLIWLACGIAWAGYALNAALGAAKTADCFIDVSFWPVRIGSTALAGLWVLLLVRWAQTQIAVRDGSTHQP